MSSAADALPGWARALLATARTGHLATVTPGDPPLPHVLPVCYALVGDDLVVAIDEKPKSGRPLRRLRNIEATGTAALVVDVWDEDWSRLAWVQARGSALVTGPDDAGHADAIAALRAKYPQYRAMRLESAELIVLTPRRWTCWRATGDDATTDA